MIEVIEREIKQFGEASIVFKSLREVNLIKRAVNLYLERCADNELETLKMDLEKLIDKYKK